MDFIDFLKEMICITDDFGIISIDKYEYPEKVIKIHLKYIPNCQVSQGCL